MKKMFFYSTVASAVALAISPAIAQETAVLDEVSVVSSGSMYKMGEVPVHQAKSAVAISREDLDKQDVKKADEIGRYQAGFANQVFGNDTNTNWFRVRGAEVSQAVDGLPTFSYGFFTPYVETFGLEAVEVTKGADSMTFGAANSGGLINYVTKRAHRDQIGRGEFKTNFGSNNLYGFGADYTGKTTDDENVRYRVVASLNHTDGEWKDTDNKTVYIAPSLEWDISERTRLSILTSYQKDSGTPSSNFYPQEGTLRALPDGSYYSRNLNFGDPLNDHEENKQYGIGYELSHDFGNGLRANSSYRYNHVENNHRGGYIYPSAYAADWSAVAPSANGYNVSGQTVFNQGKAISHSTDNRISWDFKNDWLKNTVVVGTDYRHNKVDAQYSLYALGYTANLRDYRASWNQTGTPVGTDTHIKSRQLGFYLQNQARIADKYLLGFGIRHDRARQNEYTSDQTIKNNHTSYSGSLMYEGAYGLNPYFSYSESFRLPVGLSGNQSLYDPNITRQYELGVKYLPTWLDGVITLAGFRAKDTGALVNNGTGATISSADPIYRKGFELQADVNLTENWNATLAYTYTKAESEAATGEKTRQSLIPTNTLAARTAYNFTDGVLNGLTVGAGVRYLGHSVTSKGSLYSHARVPSATVVDLMARYNINQNWSAQLNVDNVGNRKYVAACDYYCYYGAERKVNATVSYKF
ncbi:TonB-dependent siderophore receptor [Actinobacillus pleuropneumoniae]|uniref:TonB-dependent siderophore receptor n=1 Tax=Actinobacillus pleuropneumoniae TaxID=715 RepID=UPI001C026EA2|nr:TonB-dependent siderophore receptor [Actinobacillus pleuropneumoniae]MBT9318835.1 TonB-dependent siderophore receptor [Actinobacillus pleuropneumoniae]MBT9343473.1 TonB-dependent siderophore receptor [Actinobacillus pleuropneumoniae]